MPCLAVPRASSYMGETATRQTLPDVWLVGVVLHISGTVEQASEAVQIYFRPEGQVKHKETARMHKEHKGAKTKTDSGR